MYTLGTGRGHYPQLVSICTSPLQHFSIKPRGCCKPVTSPHLPRLRSSKPEERRRRREKKLSLTFPKQGKREQVQGRKHGYYPGGHLWGPKQSSAGIINQGHILMVSALEVTPGSATCRDAGCPHVTERRGYWQKLSLPLALQSDSIHCQG